MTTDRFTLLSEWKGTVTRRFGATFEARGSNRCPCAYCERPRDFDFDDVSENDRALIVPGARFTYTTGYRDRGGVRWRESTLWFRGGLAR